MGTEARRCGPSTGEGRPSAEEKCAVRHASSAAAARAGALDTGEGRVRGLETGKGGPPRGGRARRRAPGGAGGPASGASREEGLASGGGGRGGGGVWRGRGGEGGVRGWREHGRRRACGCGRASAAV